MRTIVDLPEEQIKALDKLCKGKRVSRASLIRKAISAFLSTRGNGSRNKLPGFGLWNSSGPDGLDHQRGLRSEWQE